MNKEQLRDQIDSQILLNFNESLMALSHRISTLERQSVAENLMFRMILIEALRGKGDALERIAVIRGSVNRLVEDIDKLSSETATSDFLRSEEVLGKEVIRRDIGKVLDAAEATFSQSR